MAGRWYNEKSTRAGGTRAAGVWVGIKKEPFGSYFTLTLGSVVAQQKVTSMKGSQQRLQKASQLRISLFLVLWMWSVYSTNISVYILFSPFLSVSIIDYKAQSRICQVRIFVELCKNKRQFYKSLELSEYSYGNCTIGQILRNCQKNLPYVWRILAFGQNLPLPEVLMCELSLYSDFFSEIEHIFLSVV